MRKLFYCSMAVGLMLASCGKKEDPKPKCEVDGTGTVTLTNLTEVTYAIYFDGELAVTLKAGESATDDVKAGGYKLTTVPEQFEETVAVKACETETYILR